MHSVHNLSHFIFFSEIDFPIGIDSSLGIDSSVRINSSLGTDSSLGIDSSKGIDSWLLDSSSKCQNELQFTIPNFEELAHL